jgi:polar amino acid transport system substrate-binding protein
MRHASGSDDAALKTRMNNAISKIRAEGTYDEISKKYFDLDIYAD